MKHEELDLWSMVDVGHYNSSGTLFNLKLGMIEDKIQKNQKDVQQLYSELKCRYQKISARFQEMDIGSLDNRFPVNVLTELRNEVFPQMGTNYDELDALLMNYVSDTSSAKTPILEKIEECRGLLEKMRTLGREFGSNERYIEYRATNPSRNYLD